MIHRNCMTSILIFSLIGIGFSTVLADDSAQAVKGDTANRVINSDISKSSAKKVVIDTPNLCQKVRNVDYDNVYLVSIGGDCARGLGKATVEISPEIQAVNIYTDGAFWKRQDVSAILAISLDKLKDLNLKSRKDNEQLTIPDNSHNEWAIEKAKDFVAIYNSPEFKQRVEAEVERLKKDVFNATIENYYKDDKNISPLSSPLSENERVYVFVSSSVPLETLRTYAAQIDKAGDRNIVMVLRGFLEGNNRKKATQRFVSSVLIKDPSCKSSVTQCSIFKTLIEIDPLLFKRYNVFDVPSVVYASDIKLLTTIGSEGIESNASVNKHYKVQGDASLDYIIDTINNEARKPSLRALSDKLKKGFY